MFKFSKNIYQVKTIMKRSKLKRRRMHRTTVWQIHEIDGIFGKLCKKFQEYQDMFKNSKRSNFFGD